jgi:adenylate cyclase 10
MWVLAIDDCEFMDDESWELLDTLFEIRYVLVVTTMGRDKLLKSVHSIKVMQDARVKVVHLKAIERWYLGAIACQMLDVYGLSPELEK